MYEFLDLLVYMRAVEARSLPIVQYTESNMLAHVIQELDDATNATTIFVGHDDDMDALATFYNLQWVIPPYPTNHSLPGGIVRFDLWSTTENPEPYVEVTLLYTTYDTDNGELTSVPATFLSTGSNTMDYASFRGIAENLIYTPCVNLTGAALHDDSAVLKAKF